MRKVLLIIGPPGAGKTTHAQTSGLTHLEREHYNNDQDYRRAAAQAASKPDAQLAIVRCCPTIHEQLEWEQLTHATHTIVLDTDAAECARRIHQRGRRNWRAEVKAARDWHTTRKSSTPRTSRQW